MTSAENYRLFDLVQAGIPQNIALKFSNQLDLPLDRALEQVYSQFPQFRPAYAAPISLPGLPGADVINAKAKELDAAYPGKGAGDAFRNLLGTPGAENVNSATVAAINIISGLTPPSLLTPPPPPDQNALLGQEIRQKFGDMAALRFAETLKQGFSTEYAKNEAMRVAASPKMATSAPASEMVKLPEIFGAGQAASSAPDAPFVQTSPAPSGSSTGSSTGSSFLINPTVAQPSQETSLFGMTKSEIQALYDAAKKEQADLEASRQAYKTDQESQLGLFATQAKNDRDAIEAARQAFLAEQPKLFDTLVGKYNEAFAPGVERYIKSAAGSLGGRGLGSGGFEGSGAVQEMVRKASQEAQVNAQQAALANLAQAQSQYGQLGLQAAATAPSYGQQALQRQLGISDIFGQLGLQAAQVPSDWAKAGLQRGFSEQDAANDRAFQMALANLGAQSQQDVASQQKKTMKIGAIGSLIGAGLGGLAGGLFAPGVGALPGMYFGSKLGSIFGG